MKSVCFGTVVALLSLEGSQAIVRESEEYYSNLKKRQLQEVEKMLDADLT